MAYTSLSGSKLRSKLGATLNESSATTPLHNSSSFAKRHLQKMGWTEGTGLGKRRDGNVTHIRIQQREEEAGLGKEKDGIKGVGDVWWKESVGGTLARLQSKSKGKKSKSKDKDKKSKDKEKSAAKTFTDQELFIATNGARFGMRAQRRAEGKWKRTEEGQTLEELEKKAKKSMEWNGRGEARLVSSGEGGRKRRRDDEEVAVDGDKATKTVTTEEETESEKKRLKKLRKQEKKREKAHKVSSDEDVVETKDEKKKKKKMKSKRWWWWLMEICNDFYRFVIRYEY